MSEANWGEHKASQRQAAQRRSGQWTLVACFVVANGARFTAGLVDGLFGRGYHPDPAPLETGLTALALPIVAITMGLRTWRLLDEVQRREALAWLAATGTAMIIARPVILIAQPVLRLSDPPAVQWYAAIITGAVVAAIQRWRRS